METGINLCAKWPYQEIIRAFAENGIRRTFVNVEHPEFDGAMAALKKANITVDFLHAPFKKQNTIWAEGEEGDAMLSRLLKSVDICVAHGITVEVAHVSGGRPMPAISPVGLSRFDRFMDYARRNGVTVAFESHRFVENVRFMMERYPEAGFCLDTSHEDAFTPGFRYMPLWGHRLVATHLSDNEYVCDVDMHMLPFDGHIDFTKTAREIAESGRELTMMLEIKPDNHPRYRDLTCAQYYTAAAASVRKFAAMVDAFRNP